MIFRFMANGALSSQQSGEGNIRRAIVEADLVEGIVALPTQLFYNTGIPVSLWFINKNKKQPGKTLFIDARNLGTMISRKMRELMEEDIQAIAKAFIAFEEGSLEPTQGFSAVATIEDIAKQDFILTPGRYVGIEEQVDDEEPFEEKLQRLTSTLAELFEESSKLQNQIRENLMKLKLG